MGSYFDYNATTPVCLEARQAWTLAQESQWRNPSSPTCAGAKVAVAMDGQRESLAGSFGCEPEHLVFCSGATEANNAVMAHFANVYPDKYAVISAIEHSSVREAARAHFGGRVWEAPVSSEGVVDVEALEARLQAGDVAVCAVLAAHNETGVLQPWEAVAQCCRGQGVAYLCDAAQWVGKLPVGELGRVCDFVTLCGHKFGAPKGVGVLKTSSAYSLKMLVGGQQEHGVRAGTEDFPAMVALVAAFERCAQRMAWDKGLGKHRDAFEEALALRVPGVRVLGGGAERLWNTSFVLMPDFENTRWVRLVESLGFEVSTGSACQSGKAGESPMLAAMGVLPEAHKRTLRISGGWESTREQWLDLAKALGDVFKTLQQAQRAKAGEAGSQVIDVDGL